MVYLGQFAWKCKFMLFQVRANIESEYMLFMNDILYPLMKKLSSRNITCICLFL